MIDSSALRTRTVASEDMVRLSNLRMWPPYLDFPVSASIAGVAVTALYWHYDVEAFGLRRPHPLPGHGIGSQVWRRSTGGGVLETRKMEGEMSDLGKRGDLTFSGASWLPTPAVKYERGPDSSNTALYPTRLTSRTLTGRYTAAHAQEPILTMHCLTSFLQNHLPLAVHTLARETKAERHSAWRNIES
jgi:hypothetical protein